MKNPLILLFLTLFLAGCSGPEPVSLQFRIAEEEPAPGLEEVVFGPTGKRFHLHREVLLSQSDVDSASAIRHGEHWAVELRLTTEGGRRFAELTENNVGKRCAMILDGELVTAPRIMAPIRVGLAILTGDFREEEARRIARALSKP